MMKECIKRQHEIVKGKEQDRCLHNEASTYLQIVNESTCDSCPVRQSVQQKPSCQLSQHRGSRFLGSSKYVAGQALPLFNKHEGYPDCPFRDSKNGKLFCTVTGLSVTPEICHRCDKETAQEARLKEAHIGNKILNYGIAIRRWVAAGKPVRSQERILQIFDQHCSKCERYDPDRHACKNCGCAVSEVAEPLNNKLAMATESCPLGQFPAEF